MNSAGAEVLVVYSIQEGLSIMERVIELKLPLKGIYITVAPLNPAWADFGAYGNYVVTPGQWSDMAVSPCSVFGSISEYVRMYDEEFGHIPDYNAAMSTFGGILMQLAMQVSLVTLAAQLFLRTEYTNANFSFSYFRRAYFFPSFM
jgi:hypothetical protein